MAMQHTHTAILDKIIEMQSSATERGGEPKHIYIILMSDCMNKQKKQNTLIPSVGYCLCFVLVLNLFLQIGTGA